MHSKQQFCNLLSRTISLAATAALAVTIVLALTVVLTQAAQAQTFTVIHSFAATDGAFPLAGLTLAAPGTFYGTTSEGGGPYGNVFRLTYSDRYGWMLNQLYYFTGGSDGNELWDGVVIAPDGTLYGTTIRGGTGVGCAYDPTYGCGTVFRLTPPPTALAPWNENVIHRFAGGSDGVYPQSDVTFDQSGNVYGTTSIGGSGVSQDCPDGCGTVYKLTPSGRGWTETVLWSFHSADGAYPLSGVVVDKLGNVYGVTSNGGQYGEGEVYQLSPSGSGWTQNIPYSFTGRSDGGTPIGGLIFDASGNLLGTTSTGGSGGGGTVFELTPTTGGSSFSTLYSLPGFGGFASGPRGNLTIDAAGNIYGATNRDGAGDRGSVFKLARSNGSWTYTPLHDFTAGTDGGWPNGSLVLDANGHLYGTTNEGGTYPCYCGVIFEITP